MLCMCEQLIKYDIITKQCLKIKKIITVILNKILISCIHFTYYNLMHSQIGMFKKLCLWLDKSKNVIKINFISRTAVYNI